MILPVPERPIRDDSEVRPFGTCPTAFAGSQPATMEPGPSFVISNHPHGSPPTLSQRFSLITGLKPGTEPPGSITPSSRKTQGSRVALQSELDAAAWRNVLGGDTEVGEVRQPWKAEAGREEIEVASEGGRVLGHDPSAPEAAAGNLLSMPPTQVMFEGLPETQALFPPPSRLPEDQRDSEAEADARDTGTAPEESADKADKAGVAAEEEQKVSNEEKREEEAQDEKDEHEEEEEEDSLDAAYAAAAAFASDVRLGREPGAVCNVVLDGTLRVVVQVVGQEAGAGPEGLPSQVRMIHKEASLPHRLVSFWFFFPC
jgi:hypothetical protein